MRKLWITLTIVIAFGVFTLQYTAYSPEFPPPPEHCDPSAIGSRDYSIYRTLMGQYAAEYQGNAGIAILISETDQVSKPYLSNPDFSVGRLISKMLASRKNVTLSQNAVSNFLRVSTEIVPLDREQFDELPIMFSDEAELDEVLDNKGGWGEIGMPDSVSEIVRFSRIGFSCDGNQALMYRSEYCGPTCGHGVLQVVEKNGNRWRVVLSRLLWTSCPEPACGRFRPVTTSFFR